MRIFLIISIIFICAAVHAQRLNVFGAELGKIQRNGKDLRMPYEGTKCYFGFIDSTWKASDTAVGKSFYYLYFNLPDSTKEIGVRLMSPVSSVIFPNKNDLVEKGYYNYRKTNETCFDPWIALERKMVINDTVKNDSLNYEWIMLESNDDNDELFEQPSGKNTNALFRVISDTLQPYKKLKAGLYRIVVSDMKTNEISGSFILQIGAAIPLKGIKISRTPSEIPAQ